MAIRKARATRGAGVRARAARVGIAIALTTAAAHPAGARSQLAIAAPRSFGEFEATTYDDGGQAIGRAQLVLRKTDGGRVEMSSRTSIDGGARNEVRAVLALDGERGQMRLISQRVESFDEHGASRGVIAIDHEGGTGSCERNKTGDSASIALPEDDRIANAVLNLLFAPIARDGVERIAFQVFLCRGGPRILDFVGSSVPRVDAHAERRVVDVQYRPDLGPLLRWLPDAVLPELHFWLDENGEYLAHRIPLYTDGPEVLVIRSDLSPTSLEPRSGE